MKYLSSLLLLILLASCNQSADKSTDERKFEPYETVRPDTASTTTQTVTTNSVEESDEEEDETNQWQYNVPMSGNTFRNTRTASLKANDDNAYLKLIKGKDFNMAILLLTNDRFYKDESEHQEITVTFDEEEAEEYNCSIDPDFGFLIIEQRKDFVRKLKKSKTVTIEMVSEEIVQRKKISYPSVSTNPYSSSGFGRKRRKIVPLGVSPVETTITETQLNRHTWVFNSAGLVWKY